MKLIKFPEKPTDGEVARVVAGYERQFREPDVYECQESANPAEQFENWLAPRMETIQQWDGILWRLALTVGGCFVLWLIKKSF